MTDTETFRVRLVTGDKGCCSWINRTINATTRTEHVRTTVVVIAVPEPAALIRAMACSHWTVSWKYLFAESTFGSYLRTHY